MRIVAISARFDHFVAIDWSGAVGSRLPGLAVAICTRDSAAPRLVRPAQAWSRGEVVAWLTDDLPANALVGVDLGAGLPFADYGVFFPHWSDSPPDAKSLWALVDAICADDADLAATSFVDHPQASRYFRRHGGRTGDRFGIGAGRLRVTELAQRTQGLNPYSNFNLVGAAQVGKSSLTGMRALHRLAARLAIWPFDPLPPTGSVIVEIYTSLAAVAAGLRKGRTKMRDGGALDTALAVLDAAPHAPLACYTDHVTDALLSAAWLRSVADDASLWSPAELAPVAATEGWTFGIR